VPDDEAPQRTSPDRDLAKVGESDRSRDARTAHEREQRHKRTQARVVWGLVGLVAILAIGWAVTSISFSRSIDSQSTLIHNQSRILQRRNVTTDAISCFSSQQAIFSGAVRDVILGALARNDALEAKGGTALNDAHFDVCVKAAPGTTTTTTTTTTPSSAFPPEPTGP
jgi:hypothetical protein